MIKSYYTHKHTHYKLSNIFLVGQKFFKLFVIITITTTALTSHQSRVLLHLSLSQGWIKLFPLSPTQYSNNSRISIILTWNTSLAAYLSSFRFSVVIQTYLSYQVSRILKHIQVFWFNRYKVVRFCNVSILEFKLNLCIYTAYHHILTRHGTGD